MLTKTEAAVDSFCSSTITILMFEKIYCLIFALLLAPHRTAHRENYSSVQHPPPFQSLEVPEKSHTDECRLRNLAGSTYLWIVTCRYGDY
jgi:hypothetical protein